MPIMPRWNLAPSSSDAVQYGHATPSRVVEPFATLIDGYERVFYTYGPLFGLILLTGLGGVLRIRRPRGRHPRLAWAPRLEWAPRTGSMLPWVTAVVLLVFPIAVADFDYRYLLPVLPFRHPGRRPGLRAGSGQGRPGTRRRPAGGSAHRPGRPPGHLGAPRPESAVAPGN